MFLVPESMCCSHDDGSAPRSNHAELDGMRRESQLVPYTALIVEDESVLAKNIVTYLGRRGIAAHAVGSGQEALDWMVLASADVVLVDYDLPGMDGLTLIGRIRAIHATVPIVMVTGRGDALLERRARQAGALDYRTKPIGLAEVKRVLDGLVRPN